jgi:phosphatidylinositol glycan class M
MDKTIKILLLLGTILRIGFLLYGLWQDKHMLVKFTDIDYSVFTDASRFVNQKQSPYERATYRYTPLLAWLLVPNITVIPEFGKILFIICDLIVGYYIYEFLKMFKVTSKVMIISLTSIWLLNPFVITISTRGSAESILDMLVMATLYCFATKRLILGSILYGFSVHFKIYPILYSLPILYMLDSNYLGVKAKLFNSARIKFFLLSAGTFFLLTGIMYKIYGMEFLNETYFYHLIRKDHRHNFSIYFYQMYLSMSVTESFFSKILGLLTFIPQMLLIVLIGLYYYKDIIFCCFLQTYVFVTYQKVCTSQYFMWYLCFLPLIIPQSKLMKKPIQAILLIIAWVATQAIYLSSAFKLEHLGQNNYINIWLTELLLFVANIWIIYSFMKNNNNTPIFSEGKINPNKITIPIEYKNK